jgi:hypothetical protein
MVARRKAMSKRAEVGIAFAAALAALLAVGAALSMPACESVPLTAPPGTTMTLSTNPTFVPANGGVSLVTAFLVEPAGTFVPDGTEIFCYTNLGRVDPSGKSVDGVVRLNFVSDARSGTATVCCVSGGPAPSPSGSPSPTPTPTPAVGTGVTARSTSPTRVVAASDIAADDNQACTTITVGGGAPGKVVLTANPQVLAQDRTATLVANVFDQNGNPVQNVPIIFTAELAPSDTTPAPVLTEFLESGGAPRFTDSNGQAFDTLTSRVANGTLSKVVTVTANAPAGQPGTVDVTIFYAVSR